MRQKLAYQYADEIMSLYHKEDRQKVLDSVPEEMRDLVKKHVEFMFHVKFGRLKKPNGKRNNFK